MRYSPADKERVRERYQEGMSCREIAEATGIPLRTIHRWKPDMVPESHSVICCVVCGKPRRVLRSGIKYCSTRCKQQAHYRRKNQPEQARQCIECQKPFKTRRKNRKYCSKKCQNTAAQRRRRQQLSS